MTWAWGLTDLDQSATLVLLALADAANDEGVAWPSQAEIGRKSRLQERAVRRQLVVLRDLGLISWESRATSRGRRSNLYLVHVGAQPERVSPAQSQPVAKTGWGAVPQGEPVDNLEMRRSEPTGRKDRLETQPVADDRCQPVTGDRLHIEEPNPHIESPDLTYPDLEGESGAGARSGPVGSIGAAGGVAAEAADSLGEETTTLIVECLPETMQALDAVGARRVVDLLVERIEAGWTSRQIRAAMDSPLPPTVHRLAALVAKRLEVNVDPALAPERLRSTAERAQRARLRPVEEPEDPVFAAACAAVRADHPGASHIEVVRIAERRLASGA